MCPFDGQTGCEMPDGSLGRVVGRLRLRHIDNGAGHGADHDHGALGLALHEMSGHFAGEKVGTVNIDAPELLHAVWRVCYGIEVLGEAGRCNKMIDFAMCLDNVGHDLFDGHVVGHVTVVGGDFRDPVYVNE